MKAIMMKFFPHSLTPDRKKNEILDFKSIKIPSIRLGILHKSVQQLKADVSYKLQYSEAIKRLDISPNPHKYRNPFKSKPEPLFQATIKRKKWAHDFESDEFIEAMFFGVNNSYKLLNSEMETPVDYFNAEIQLKGLKRLKPMIKILEPGDVEKPPLEAFWFKNISSYTTIRWDLFEEALCRYFILNINTSIGKARKIN